MAPWIRTTLRAIRGGLLGLGILVLLVTFTPLDYVWATWLAGPWDDPTGDVLVVLSGSELDSGGLGTSSYWRSVVASHLYRTEHFKEILISGSTSRPMRDFLIAEKVPAEAIRLELGSTNTRESAIEVAKLLRQEAEHYRNQRLVLLTSDYHMRRSHRLFVREGIQIQPRPFADARKRASVFWERWGVFVDLVMETTKFGYYWGRRWL